MGTPIESGNNFPLISLGGVVSQRGTGRLMYSEQISGTGATVLLVDNPRRLSAIIQNIGTTNAMVVSFPTTGSGITLGVGAGGAGGTLQIDKDFPWTGIVIGSGSGAWTVNVTEVSIQ